MRVLHEQADDAAPVHVLTLMPADHRRDLLETALDFWAAGAAEPPVFEVVTLDEPDDSDPLYGVTFAELAVSPHGSQRLPMLTLNPQSGDAGLEDLLHRCGLPAWDAATLPPADARWRARFDIATRSLEGIAHIDAEGFDDRELFYAREQVKPPARWWDLADRTETVLLCGPLEDATAPEEALADGVALAGVRARARFLCKGKPRWDGSRPPPTDSRSTTHTCSPIPPRGRSSTATSNSGLADGAPGADGLRTGCSCGWVDRSPAPPRLPEQALGWDRVRAAQEHGHRLGDHLLDPGPPPVVEAWMDHHIHTWWGHLAREVPGTNADAPSNRGLAAVAGLLEEVEEHPLPALHALRQMERAIARARLLAEAAVQRRAPAAGASTHTQVKVRVRGTPEGITAFADAIREGRLTDLSLGPDVVRSGFVDRYGQAHVPTTLGET